jgi:hypothetical protein
MILISDDGKVLLDSGPGGADSNPLQFPRNISPDDVVGGYQADTFITILELLRFRDERLKLGEAVAQQDRANFHIPLANLTAGWCIDIFPHERETGEQLRATWNNADEQIMRRAAAELAIMRELRDKRIGIEE